MPLIPALRRQKQVDFCELQASLVDIAFQEYKDIVRPCIDTTKFITSNKQLHFEHEGPNPAYKVIISSQNSVKFEARC